MIETEGGAEELTEHWQCVLHFSIREEMKWRRCMLRLELQRGWDGASLTTHRGDEVGLLT